jgi:hypothetical protein
VVQVLPRMAGEAPPGYVAFVARHLEPLRRDAARVVGDESDADQLYPDVLTDVAARWSWLELMRTRLGRTDAAETYLQRAFQRRSERWRADQESESLVLVDVKVLRPDAGIWSTVPVAQSPVAQSPVGWFPVGWSPVAQSPVGWSPAAPTPRSSAATRLAPFVRPPARTEVGPLAEAAVAWWHAYEARRRRLLIVTLAVALAFIMVLLHIGQASGFGATGA